MQLQRQVGNLETSQHEDDRGCPLESMAGESVGEATQSRREEEMRSAATGHVYSRLCKRLLQDGWEVLCLYNLITGSEAT